MKLFDYLKGELREEFDNNATIDINDNKEYEKTGVHTDSYYYNMKDPNTGLRYDIPMLMTNDPVYYFKYIRYMKMKEQNEETFNKILGWN